MTATRTRSQIGRSNRRQGADRERDVANYLARNGFPHAERAGKNGNVVRRDTGDIDGVPGIAWQVKSSPTESIPNALRQAEEQALAAGADLGIVVHKRQRCADPGRWWAWLPLADVGYLCRGRNVLQHRHRERPVCLELGDLLPLLHAAGYGRPEGQGRAEQGFSCS